MRSSEERAIEPHQNVQCRLVSSFSLSLSFPLVSLFFFSKTHPDDDKRPPILVKRQRHRGGKGKRKRRNERGFCSLFAFDERRVNGRERGEERFLESGKK